MDARIMKPVVEILMDWWMSGEVIAGQGYREVSNIWR